MGVKFGKWGAVFETLTNVKSNNEKAAKLALTTEAQFLRGKMLDGLRDQAPGGKQFKPLSEETLAVRKFLGFKGKKALLKHGDLRNGITVYKGASGTVFVGILRTATASDGQNLVDVALLQEKGSNPIVIKMTPKMRALLFAAFRKAGINRRDRVRAWRAGAYQSTGIIVIQIPARPFIQPVIDKYGKDCEARIAKTYAESMKALDRNVNIKPSP